MPGLGIACPTVPKPWVSGMGDGRKTKMMPHTSTTEIRKMCNHVRCLLLFACGRCVPVLLFIALPMPHDFRVCRTCALALGVCHRGLPLHVLNSPSTRPTRHQEPQGFLAASCGNFYALANRGISSQRCKPHDHIQHPTRNQKEP